MIPSALFYSDSHLTAFTARVISCVPAGDQWAVTLDNTAFYPEGGGQPCDLGTLGGVPVLDVQEKGDAIIHTCAAPLEPGQEVTGEIDWARRFDLMQHHSGEHILSGLVHRKYGFHNVGFHMGRDTITIDFDGIIPQEDLPELENAVNRAIWANLPVSTRFAQGDELAAIPYRSKKPLEGTVRIVEFPGYDICACCGTHVKRTGEIGLLKLLSWVKFRQGVRMELVCGGRAVSYLGRILEQNRQVSQVFSAKPLETGDAARKFAAESEAMKYRMTGLENQIFDACAKEFEGKGNVTLFREDLSGDGLRRLTDKVGAACGGRCAVFCGTDEGGYRYAILDNNADLRPFVKAMNLALHGRGGGKPNFVQGSLEATRAEIESYLKENA